MSEHTILLITPENLLKLTRDFPALHQYVELVYDAYWSQPMEEETTAQQMGEECYRLWKHPSRPSYQTIRDHLRKTYDWDVTVEFVRLAVDGGARLELRDLP